MPTAAELTGRSKTKPRKAAGAKKAPASKAQVKPAELDTEDEEQTGTAEPTEAPARTLLTDLGASLDDELTTVNGLWYGGPGTGKTSAVASMANLGPILVINAEGGLKRRPLQGLGVNTKNITVWPADNERVTYERLDALYWTVKDTIETNPGSIVGIVWDSLTEIAKALLDHAIEDAVEKARRQHKDRDRFFIDRQDYGTMTEQARLLLRRFRDLPVHFVMTALMRRDQDDDGKVVYNPAVTPALQTDVMGFVDVICHTTVVETGDVDEYRGLFTPSGKFEGKDRFGALPDRLITPSFERVFRYIEDELTVDTDDVMAEGKARRRALAEKRTKESTAAESTDSADDEDKEKA